MLVVVACLSDLLSYYATIDLRHAGEFLLQLSLLNELTNEMKINQKKKMKNTEILSAGSKVYAKKRKAKKETVESVDFDDASRT
jgi:hypothetical protein